MNLLALIWISIVHCNWRDIGEMIAVTKMQGVKAAMADYVGHMLVFGKQCRSKNDQKEPCMADYRCKFESGILKNECETQRTFWSTWERADEICKEQKDEFMCTSIQKFCEFKNGYCLMNNAVYLTSFGNGNDKSNSRVVDDENRYAPNSRESSVMTYIQQATDSNSLIGPKPK